MGQPDTSLDTLLLLDGEIFFADANCNYYVKFNVKQAKVTPERPHGLHYSLTLHDKDNHRLMGFDNAHAIHEGSGPGARTRIEYDHQHGEIKVRFYTFHDSATLLADFWNEVEAILKKEHAS